jgi:hypothetical protein
MSEQLNVARLAELLAKATPGPWSVHPRAETAVLASDGYSATNTESNLFDSHARNIANAALIVAAVNALPALLLQVAERDAEIARLRDKRAEFMAKWGLALGRVDAAKELLRDARDLLAVLRPCELPTNTENNIAAFLAANGTSHDEGGVPK